MSNSNLQQERWELAEIDYWPFRMEILSGGEVVAAFDRCATATGQNTLDDCMMAVGFSASRRADIQEKLSQQLARVRLMVASPSIYSAALKILEHHEATQRPDSLGDEPGISELRDAVAMVEGGTIGGGE